MNTTELWLLNCSAMETVQLLLVISLTINVNLVVYVFPPVVLVWLLKKRRRRERNVTTIFRCYEKRPNLLRKLFSDFFFSSVLFIFGIYLLAGQKINRKPFERFTDDKLQTAMAVQLGNRLFRLLCPLAWPTDKKRSFSCSCYGMVTIFSLVVILLTQENNIFALLSLLFEGSVIWGDISRAERQHNKCACASIRHVIPSLGNLVATLSLRVICPTVLLAVSCSKSNILRMSYISLSLFILDIVFYYSLSVLELYSVCSNLNAFWKSRQENQEESSTVLPGRTNTANNNIYTSITTSLGMNNLNNMQNRNIDSELVGSVHQVLHGPRLPEDCVIRNF